MIQYILQYFLLFPLIISCGQINYFINDNETNSNGHRNLLDSSILKNVNFDWKAYLKYNTDLTMLKTEAEALNHFIHYGLKEGRRYNKVMPGMENFDWKSYLELNTDIANVGINTENQAYAHYSHFGRYEGRHHFKIVPLSSSYNDARDKILDYIDGLKTNNVPYKKANLVIYHIEDVEFSSNSIDVTMNNAKLFGSIIENDDYNDMTKSKMFYWVNVAGVSKNPLAFNFKESANVAIVEWQIVAEDINSHLETLNLLGYDIAMQFSAIFFSSTGVRGPFNLRNNLAWVDEYRYLLDINHNGLVGATITCTGKIAHVQTHFFVIRSDLVRDILIDLNTNYEYQTQWVSLASYYEIALTTITKNVGYKIASMIHYKNLNETSFRLQTGCANNSEARGKVKLDTNIWCKPKINDVNFLRWSGESLGAQRFLCNKAIAMNEDSINDMQISMTKIMKEIEFNKKLSNTMVKYDKNRIESDFVISEAITGGILHDLYKAYSEDMWLDQSIKHQHHNNVSRRSSSQSSFDSISSTSNDNNIQNIPKNSVSNVCFVVATLKTHDSKQQAASKYSSLRSEVDIFIKSIIRQSSPNWKVYFYPVDRISFSKRFKDIVNELKDGRFSLIEVINKHLSFRLKPSDTFKIITNKVLEIVQSDTDCTWISITNADNVYGSDVVRRVINGRKKKITLDGSWNSFKYQYNDMVFVPFDSKDYAHQDYIQRNQFRWDQRCLDVEAMLQHNLVAYTAQPVPYPGRVELAAIFFYREKFVEDQVTLGNDTNLILHPAYKSNFPKCTALNCEDGELAFYLVRYKNWNYQRLSLDGFKSMVFHGPSPTLCVASGNVWFDYPSPNQVSCLTHKTIELLQERDKSGRAKVAAFDWKTFFEGDRLCLRLSEAGFVSQLKTIRKAEVTGQKGITMIDKKMKRPPKRQLDNFGQPNRQLNNFVQPNRHLNNFEEPNRSRSLERKINTQLPFGFDWRTYLKMNPDLISAGLITKKLAIDHYLSIGSRENRPYMERTSNKKFFWKDYLELNKDVPKELHNEQGALQHYKNFGYMRPSLELKPTKESLNLLIEKMRLFSEFLNYEKIPMQKRSIVIYHLESKLFSFKSLDIYYNNLNIFLYSVNEQKQAININDQYVFYIFNVVDDNKMELPTHYANVGKLAWLYPAPELYLHLLTMKILSNKAIITSFSALFFTSSNTRGPLAEYNNTKWISKYRDILDVNDVGLIGSTISCIEAPHVQTYFFGIRTIFVSYILDEMNKYRNSGLWQRSMIDYFEIELSSIIIRAGYNIASLSTNIKMNQHFFKDTCTNTDKFSMPTNYLNDYHSWCEINPKDVIYMKWTGDGEYLKDSPSDGFLCSRFTNMLNAKVNKVMEDTLLDIIHKENKQKLQLILPESLRGGITYDLGKQYSREAWQDRFYKTNESTYPTTDIPTTDIPSGDISTTMSSDSILNKYTTKGKVCFLVRTASVHDNIQSENSKYSYDEEGIFEFVQSLLRQTNPNWYAYFFITDPKPFDNRLNRILGEFDDPRLKYFNLTMRDRPDFTRADAGYTSTDRVLSHLRSRKECAWLSVTNADNVYGSNIVSSVLTSGKNQKGKQYDMLLAPLDSRNFAQHDYRKRNEGAINERCVGLNAMIKHNLIAFTVQPIPMLGKVDLAAVFLNRKKLHDTNLFFGNFTHPIKYPCIGCQDGYLTQHLVRIKRWTYLRLPIDGLKSIIFHGPSPTLCVASHKVWFDYPHVNKVGCFNHDVVASLENLDDKINPKFDWDNFYQNDRQCLRLIKFGTYDKATGKVT